MAGVPDNHAETVGQRLRRLRLALGVSQRDLSAPGITYAYISRIEAGTRQPSVKALRMLARKLGVTPEYLETGSELAGDQTRELRLAGGRGLRLRLDGETDTAEAYAILDEAEAAADVAATARARILLGFLASASGDHLGTIEHLSRVLGSELVSPASRPDVYATLGHAYALGGLPAEAVALFERALEELGRAEPGNRAAEVRYATYLSYALTRTWARSPAPARCWPRCGRARCRSKTDTRASVSTGRSGGWRSRRQNRWRRSTTSAVPSRCSRQPRTPSTWPGRTSPAPQAALSAGEELDGASSHLEEAEALLRGQVARADLAVIRRLQSLLSLRGPATAGTPSSCREQALELASGDPGEQGRAWAALAQARAAQHDQSADEAFAEAAALLRRHASGRECAELLRAYGRFLRDAGREREALDVFEQAAEALANPRGRRPRAPRTRLARG